jgi:hypothetical protein
MKLADVDALFDQKVLMHRNRCAGQRGVLADLEPAGVGPDQDGSLFLNQPPRPLQRDAG